MQLSETWFMEGYIDFELQKYRLLSYLQTVNQCFNQSKLYPQFSDVIFHYNNLVAFRDNKRFLQEQFPRKVNEVDVKNLELVYEQMLADNELMQELENITNYALGQMKSTIENGAEIYEFIEQKMNIEPVGILPLYKKDGYLLLRFGNLSEVRAYSYNVSLFENRNARYRGLKMQYVNTWTCSLVTTIENIKIDIIRNIPALPNPAVYMIATDLAVPLDETLLPIARRMLIRHLAMS